MTMSIAFLSSFIAVSASQTINQPQNGRPSTGIFCPPRQASDAAWTEAEAHITMYCQKCRTPLRLDGSLEDLNPAAYDLLVGKAPRPLRPCNLTSSVLTLH